MHLSLIHIYFWPDCAGIELGEYLKLTPEMNGMKCRVIYDGSGIKAVSYTHLDVYKRQLQARGRGKYHPDSGGAPQAG